MSRPRRDHPVGIDLDPLHHRLQRMLEALIRGAPAERRGALEHRLATMPS